MIRFIFMNFFLLCVLALGGALYYLTLTEAGLQIEVQFLTRVFPQKLHIGSASGTLFSAFSLKNISWKDSSATVDIQSVNVSWDPRGLLSHRLVIHALNVDHATVIIQDNPASSNTTTNNNFSLDLLKKITLEQARFNQIFIRFNDTKIRLNGTLQKNWSVTLQATLPKKTLSLPDSKGLLTINGSIDGPCFTPMIHLSTKRIAIPALGISANAIYLQGNLTQNSIIPFTGSFLSGKGRALLQGSVDLSEPDYPLLLKITGSRLEAVHLPGYHMLISPNLTLQWMKKNLAVTGSILIPAADITPEQLNSADKLPDDVVFVPEKKSTSLPFTTSLELTVTLSDAIHLDSHNLKANLAGHLQIKQAPLGQMNAVGELYTKNGSYTAYGQTLKIQTGRLIFTGGSVMNPGLDVLAVKKFKSINTGGNVSSFSGTTSLAPTYTGTELITVGVEVSGTLNNPVFGLYSEPLMAQADILSYLVFGFPQSEANGNQYGAILSALSSLSPTTANAGNVTKNLQEKLGLTQLGVESVQTFNPNATDASSSVTSTTSLVVGKKLSDKLSIHYSIGLFNPVSILNLRYKLSKSWAIQSETSTLDNGADVLYTIERD